MPDLDNPARAIDGLAPELDSPASKLDGHAPELDGWVAAGNDAVRADRVIRAGGGQATNRNEIAGNLDGFTFDLIARFRAFFRGEGADFSDLDVDLEGYTPFHRACTEVMRSVPRGELVTYGELAALAGAPGAARAAGTFCARNRLSVIVPCHRVVAAGAIGGYGSLGAGYKRRLLALEGVTL